MISVIFEFTLANGRTPDSVARSEAPADGIAAHG